jgi:hypothetical protein
MKHPMNRWYLAALTGLLPWAANADAMLYDPAKHPNVGSDLALLGGAWTENTSELWTVPGTLGSTSLTFEYLAQSGGFEFSFGYYLSTDLAPISQSRLLFDERTATPGDSITVSLPAGAQIGFWLIPDGTVAHPGFKLPLFSETGKNLFCFDQLLSFEQNSPQGGLHYISWEDVLLPLGDKDYNDARFAFSAASTPQQPVPEPAEYAALAGLGLVGFAAYRRWKRA